jgi:ATP-binding protein involved in chromosome partitioning
LRFVAVAWTPPVEKHVDRGGGVGHLTQVPHDHQHPHAEASHTSSKPQKLPGITHVIAVGSGKGGVGKSTVSVNLALALQQVGGRVGLVDADILGPSIPGMLGLPANQPPAVTAAQNILPAERYGVRTMSMGMLTGDDSPAILRGPMVNKYLNMFIGNVEWGELDYLVIDLPPGTGDTQLTLAQNVPLSGAIIVTTPQDVSLKIARRGLRMFEKVQVPILGVVENMSTFTCPHCGKDTDVFRRGGGERMSSELGVPFLGSIPLDADVVTCGDSGQPIVLEKPKSAAARAYVAIATALVEELQGRPTSALKPFSWEWTGSDPGPGWPEGEATAASGARTTATGLRRANPRTLSVLWQDGRQADFDVRDLRLACPCALCVEEMSGRPLLDPSKVRPDVAPVTLTSVGSYGLTIQWNDGHSTGIYSYEGLRALADSRTGQVAEDV